MPLTSSPTRSLYASTTCCALGLAHLLHDHLLRGLRGDAAEFDGRHRLLDVAADLGLRIDVDRVLEAQLARRLLELLRVVGEHLPAPERLVFAGRAIDRDAHLDVVAVALARRGRERGLDRLEDHVLLDALLVRDRVDDHQNLFAHVASTIKPAAQVAP